MPRSDTTFVNSLAFEPGWTLVDDLYLPVIHVVFQGKDLANISPSFLAYSETQAMETSRMGIRYFNERKTELLMALLCRKSSYMEWNLARVPE